jgi:hypothetical protein
MILIDAPRIVPLFIIMLRYLLQVCLLDESYMKSDGGENFMYRHPILKHENWSFKPTWT